jgi:proteic killer suppression protein
MVVDAGNSLKDLAALPGNRLERLQGDRKGKYSIRINDEWRIASNGPKDHRVRSMLRSTDYH